MDPVKVEARNIRLAYGATQVLHDVTLTVEPGEFFALLGPSGSGKSTLLRLIAGFNQHQSGELLIGGSDVTGTPPWKRNVGMVFQNYALWPHMSVVRNVAFGLEERRLPRDEVKRRADAALELVGLTGFGDRRPNQLSGGQQQRVALARTLAIEPQVLLLDEPLSNLDAKLRVQMRRELQRLHKRLGITTIFVTHDQEEAMTICDRIAVLDHGVVQQVGTPLDLFDRPANRFVAQFVGSVNLFEGTLDRDSGGTRFRSPTLGDVALPPTLDTPRSGAVEIAFRPHVVEIDARNGVTPAPDNGARGQAPSGAQLQLDGVIEGGEFLGEFMRYDVRVGSSLVVADRPHLQGGGRLGAGTRVRLTVPAREVRIIGQG